MAELDPIETMFAPDGDDLAAAIEANRRGRMQEAMAGIVSRLSTQALEAVRRKSPIEARWLENMRQFWGRYDEITEKALRDTPGKSRAIINMTQAKTNAWAARLADLLFPADDRNWGISPTPVPELADTAKTSKEAAAAMHGKAEELTEKYNRDQSVSGAGDPADLASAQDAGQQAIAHEDEAAEAQAVMNEAKKRCDAMQREMDDQLTECLFPKRSRDSIDDLCQLGPGIIKGPLNGNRLRGRWTPIQQAGADGTPETVHILDKPKDDRPEFVRVNPWSFFPDPNATDMEASEYEFERHLPNRTQLRRLAKRLDFIPEAVEQLLTEGPGFGHDNNLLHLAQLRTITNEGEAVKDRYILWEYHGPLEKDDIVTILEALDRRDEARRFEEECSCLDEIRVIVYFCGATLLKIEPDYVLDSNETLYSVASFIKSPTSILGAFGVPELMRDPARALSAAWRMILDNGALSTGPQVVVDKTKVSPENGNWTMEARKVWVKTGSDAGLENNKPFEVFDIPSNIAELEQIIQLALKFIDDTTSLPLIAQGEQGKHVSDTAQGMSLLMNSANVIFRRVVKNWDDDLTTPVVRRLYDWNMQFNPKEEIKGDMQTEARGTSVLLVREQQAANLMHIAEQWSGNPVLGAAINVYGALRLTVQSLSINPDDVLVSEDDFKAKLQQMADAAAKQPQDPRIASAQILAASKASSDGTAKEIASMRRDTELLRAMNDAHLGETDIAARLQQERDKIDSNERLAAMKVGVEDRRAREAVAEGQPAASATGKGIG